MHSSHRFRFKLPYILFSIALILTALSLAAFSAESGDGASSYSLWVEVGYPYYLFGSAFALAATAIASASNLRLLKRTDYAIRRISNIYLLVLSLCMLAVWGIIAFVLGAGLSH
jgi:hypothetical protein